MGKVPALFSRRPEVYVFIWFERAWLFYFDVSGCNCIAGFGVGVFSVFLRVLKGIVWCDRFCWVA
jgi:hypothetical protein